MKAQSDFFKSSVQKMAFLGNNNINLKYYQLPTFISKNTFYNKNILNNSKSKVNNRYYLNNNNRIISFSKTKSKIKKNKSLSSSSNKQPNKANTNFYLSNINFYNSGTTMFKSDKLDNLKNINNFNLNSMNNGIYNKYSSKTVPKKNTLYKIKSTGTPLNNNNQHLKKIKIINNSNNVNNNDINNNNITTSFVNKNYFNNNKSINNFDFKYTFNIGNDNSLDKILSQNYSMYPEAKHSLNSFDVISAYGVNTYKGIFRNYNEDRVSIIVNAKNPNKNKNNNNNNENNSKKWPNISYFGIFDGHAGNKCSEYLKNNLHHFIFNSIHFPNSPLKSIEQGFKNCEKNYLKSIHNKTHNQYYDYSGSCAIIILIINDMCYIANLGDSRAIYSYNSGSQFLQLSRDQKPNDPKEKKRIYKAGGSIFKATLSQYGLNFSLKESELGFKIPFRILPGRLAVSIYLII